MEFEYKNSGYIRVKKRLKKWRNGAIDAYPDKTL
jgi:hypothetical protein